jgi:hypothetical protein
MKIMEIRYVRCMENVGYELSLTPRQVYDVIPDPTEADGMVRIVDDTGEDYLFEADLFEPVDNLTELAADVTISLTWPMKATVYRIAKQRGISMSALLREWIDEHLDLPVTA